MALRRDLQREPVQGRRAVSAQGLEGLHRGRRCRRASGRTSRARIATRPRSFCRASTASSPMLDGRAGAGGGMQEGEQSDYSGGELGRRLQRAEARRAQQWQQRRRWRFEAQLRQDPRRRDPVLSSPRRTRVSRGAHRPCFRPFLRCLRLRLRPAERWVPSSETAEAEVLSDAGLDATGGPSDRPQAPPPTSRARRPTALRGTVVRHPHAGLDRALEAAGRWLPPPRPSVRRRNRRSAATNISCGPRCMVRISLMTRIGFPGPVSDRIMSRSPLRGAGLPLRPR